MTNQVAISTAELHKIILRLANRHEGCGVVDLALAGIGVHRARRTLDKLSCESKLHRAKGGWSGRHVRWFTSELAATQYTNGPRHASPHMPQREIDRHVRMHGLPVRPVVSSGIASGVDQRYQCTPAEADRLKRAGEFSTRRPGVYTDAPASCAARASTESTKGNQPRSERGREGMGPAVCESAAGRGNGAPALVTLPQYASPGVGPMGAGQPADAGPTLSARAAK